MVSNKVALLGITCAALLGLPARASATAILITGNTSFQVIWNQSSPTLSGSADFQIGNWNGSSFSLTISSITNSTPVVPNIAARLTSFGFGLSPNATSFGAATNGTNYSWGFSNFPGFQQVDVCAFAGQNCAGGSNAGLLPGQTAIDILTLIISGNFGNGVTFSPVPVKFQTSVGSFVFDGGQPQCTGPSCNFAPVPEPGTLALFGVGLLSVVRIVRRQQKKALTRGLPSKAPLAG